MDIREQIRGKYGVSAMKDGSGKTLGDILREHLSPTHLHQKDYSPAATATLTGGKVNYYLVKVDHPQREEQPPYQAECEDIIRALGMNFDEGCLFKALWRSVNARNGNGKPGLLPVYDAEKMVHYANRILKAAKNG